MISKKKKGLVEIEMIPIREAGDVLPPIKGFEDDGTVIYGSDLLDEVIKEPTLDIYLDRSPKLNTEKDYREGAVPNLQRKRAAFITAEQKRKEPKIEGEE